MYNNTPVLLFYNTGIWDDTDMQDEMSTKEEQNNNDDFFDNQQLINNLEQYMWLYVSSNFYYRLSPDNIKIFWITQA